MLDPKNTEYPERTVVFDPSMYAMPIRGAQLFLSGLISVDVVLAASPVIGFFPAQTNLPLPLAHPSEISNAPQSSNVENQEEFGGWLRLRYQEEYSYRNPRLMVRLR